MLPTLVRAIVRLAVPARTAQHVLDELEHDYARVRAETPRLRAWIWLSRETLSLTGAYASERIGVAIAALRPGSRLAQDVRFALRRARRRPVAAVSAAVMLSFGLVAALWTAGLADVLLLRPVSEAHGDALWRVTMSVPPGRVAYRLSHTEFRQIQNELDGVAWLGAVSMTPAVIRADSVDEHTLVEVVDGDYFSAIGLRTIAGRALAEPDYQAGAAPVAVVSEVYWRRALHSRSLHDLSIIVNGVQYGVVGVAPPAGAGGFLGSTVSAWIPVRAADALLTRGWRDTIDERMFLALVLPKDIAAVHAGLERASSALRRTHPEVWRERAFRTETAAVLLGAQRRGAATLVAILAALSLLMIAVASANVGGLLLADAAAARRQIAIHVALGAGRGAILRRQVIYGAIIGLAGGFAALGVYAWLRVVSTEIALLPTLALRLDLPWTPGLLASVLALGAACGALLALGPAWWSVRAAPAETLQGGDTRTAGHAGLSRARRFLVSAQVGVSLVLMVGAVLFSRSVDERAAADLGFARGKLAAFDFDVEPAVPDGMVLPALARLALERVKAVPGIRAAAMANRAPVDASTPGLEVAPSGSASRTIADVSMNLVTPEYFDAVGLPLLAGRAFLQSEASSDSGVAVVNATLAARLYPGEDALDREIMLPSEGRSVRIVGIARDSKYRSIAEPQRPHLYLPTAPTFRLALLVRTDGDPRAVMRGVQDALSSVGPGIVGFFPRTFEDHVAIDVLPARAAALAARTLGTLGLLLSATGLYGMIAWFVEVRRREIGVRLALGASTRAIERLVAMQALRSAAPGLAAGALFAAGAGTAARSLLFGVGPLDPAAFGIAAASLAVVIALAAWLPSRRAARLDPAIVLRE